nr:MAG TPA: hypothetical protein [Caudoviricetes sp.]
MNSSIYRVEFDTVKIVNMFKICYNDFIEASCRSTRLF